MVDDYDCAKLGSKRGSKLGIIDGRAFSISHGTGNACKICSFDNIVLDTIIRTFDSVVLGCILGNAADDVLDTCEETLPDLCDGSVLGFDERSSVCVRLGS